MLSYPRTPFFTEAPSFLGKIRSVPYRFRCEDTQPNRLCYRTGNLGYFIVELDNKFTLVA